MQLLRSALDKECFCGGRAKQAWVAQGNSIILFIMFGQVLIVSSSVVSVQVGLAPLLLCLFRRAGNLQ